MALTNNPNKTRAIENAWQREIKRRFAAVNAAMLEIPLESVTANASGSQQAQIDLFMAQMNETSIGILMSEPWQNKYQTESYKRGIDRADAEVKAALSAAESKAVGALDLGATALINTDVHAAELKFLHDRANEKLGKWVNELLFDTRSILHEQLGVVSVDDIHSAITDRIKVTSSRAKTISTTEIAQASQRSVIKEVEQINSQSDVKTEVRWITVKDSKVRHLHANWHGQIMSNEQAARNITISPWNCRCGVKAVVADRVPARVNAKFAAEKKVLLAKESKS